MAETMDEASIGVVVIGRNEGERLRKCLTSLQNVPVRVYVDSGSTDDSCGLARELGFDVVDLDLSQGFSAARARNAGIEHLLGRDPALEYIQAVDGDCEVRDGWIDTARTDLAADLQRAVVFGRRRERYPNRNAYHLACDDEWDVPVGEVNSCGGDALFRVAALRDVDGYNDELIAGEEPDMCLRMRQKGWQIWSNGQEMTWHDVAIDRIGQWWKRSKRTGYGVARLVDLHGEAADPSWRRLLNSAGFWTLANLTALIGLVVLLISQNLTLSVLAVLPVALVIVQMLRLTRSKAHRLGVSGSFKWACLMMIAKAAQLRGWLDYRADKRAHKPATLIEYKEEPTGSR